MTSLNDWFAQLSETRLQQSLDRLNTTDSRALGLLGFVAVLMAGLWAVYLAHPRQQTGWRHCAVFLALGLLFISMLCAGLSLVFTVQFDSPDTAELIARYGSSRDQAYLAYFASVTEAIHFNNAVVRRKSSWLLGATLSLFLSVLVIIL
ncbi:MAG: hypothetical protein C7B43_17995 [Sulfobacillus benefaciens]|uniref:Pycsar effector protein domain-containing protein n=1 Tax=Sulfobacillus benefaciens TaxID=453960 RepID=A0A2T2WRN5_9FIRM|nr:MAG: hypothetical protein C7B43_17995 [Sulfobacillus benefaciens]